MTDYFCWNRDDPANFHSLGAHTPEEAAVQFHANFSFGGETRVAIGDPRIDRVHTLIVRSSEDGYRVSQDFAL